MANRDDRSDDAAAKRGRRGSAPWLALALFALLLALWYGWSGRDAAPPAEDGQADGGAAPVLEFDHEQIYRLTAHVGDGPRRVLVYRGPDSLQDGLPPEVSEGAPQVPPRRPWDRTEWVLVEPYAARADERNLGPLIRLLARLQPERFVDEGDDRLADYGLEDPAGRVDMELRDGTRYTIWIGDPSPIREGELVDHYARVEGKPGVFLLQGHVMDLLAKDAAALRDPYPVRFQVDQVRWVEWEGDAGRGRADDMDEPGVERWLRAWLAIQAEAFYAPAHGSDGSPPAEGVETVDPVSAGLEEPRLVIRFGVAAPEGDSDTQGEQVLEVHLGGPVPGDEDLVYMRRADEPWILAVEAHRLEEAADLPWAGES